MKKGDSDYFFVAFFQKNSRCPLFSIIFFTINTALLLSLPPNLHANSNNFSSKKINSNLTLGEPLATFTVGERLIFDVSWMGIPVGIGTLEVKEKVLKNGRPAYHLIAVAKTNDFLSKIYPVEDALDSFVDAERFVSLEFSKKLREGRYRADERIVYDASKERGFYESFLNKNKKEISIPARVQDVLSAFFWFRLQSIAVGKSLHTFVNSEEKNWDLEIQVLGLETKELRGGRVLRLVLVEPKTRLKGILYKRGRVWVYFTSDQKRTPVSIILKTPFGPIVGNLHVSKTTKVTTIN